MPHLPATRRRIVQPESMRVQILEDLRQRLQGMEFGPADRLVDTEIARAYGTSRMPAREALMLLANQGFLRQTSRGFTIPVLTPDDIRDIFEVRKLLEPHAAARAAAALAARDIARLDAAHDRVRAAADGRALMLANMEFRAAWIEALPNRRLRDAIEGFSDHAQAVRIATLREPRVQAVVIEGIDRLHAAFAARDPEAARAAMADFMAAAETEYFRSAEAAAP
jgi:DNA-binding GntR family transcriptional regulator